MRIFLAGASGVIGVRLVPLFVDAGHLVAGMTRSQDKADGLSAIGAKPVVCDVFDAVALREAVVAFGADPARRNTQSPCGRSRMRGVQIRGAERCLGARR